MEIPLTKKPDGTFALVIADGKVEEFQSLLATLRSSSDQSEAVMAESQQKDAALAEMLELRDRFSEQISTLTGFAELAEATKLLDEDQAFIDFTRNIGKGHLLKTEEPIEAAGEVAPDAGGAEHKSPLVKVAEILQPPEETFD